MKIIAALGCLLLLFLVACDQVDQTAPLGAEIFLTVQPASINTNSTATLTVTGRRDNGAPLPDGTVIRFTVGQSLGTVSPNPVETHGGVAFAQFQSGSLSGTAIITASSGDATTELEISIGQRRAAGIVVTADPPGLPVSGGKSKIRAFVFDEDGNPVSGVQVFFTSDQGTLASRGEAVVTSASGLARDTLTSSVTSQVTATTSITSVTGTATVTVTEGEPVVCSFTVSPTGAVGVDDNVFFFDTSEDPDGNIVRSTWDFGDGRTAQGPSPIHSYDAPGSYLVVHEVRDNQGITDVCDPVTVTVEEGQSPACSFLIAPSTTVNTGDVVSFADSSTDPDGSIVDSDWNFGDGSSASGITTSHVYDEPGSFFVTHTVTDDDGLSSACTPQAITVNSTGSDPTCSFTFSTIPTSFIVSFDASDSTDNDENGASIATYQWNFGNGSSNTTNIPTNSHNYTTSGAGTYPVTLTVIDDEGQRSTCPAQNVTVPGT